MSAYCKSPGIKVGKIIPLIASVLLYLICFTPELRAEITMDVYSGMQTSPHSNVNGKVFLNDGTNFPFNFTAGWKGKSVSMPPYYGLRMTKWEGSSGWGLDFNHTKAYADQSTLSTNGFRVLEFSDGLNNLTLHRQRKTSPFSGNIMPYYGYGLGIVIPHVEVQIDRLHNKTFEYQYGGPTIALNAGILYPYGENRNLFVEYKFTCSWLDVDLSDGGWLKTRILTNALNLGLSFKF